MRRTATELLSPAMTVKDALRPDTWVTAKELGDQLGLSKYAVKKKLRVLVFDGLAVCEQEPGEPPRYRAAK